MPSFPNTAFKVDSPPRTFMEPIPIRPQPHADEMIMKIETLQRERDLYKNEAEIERNKNIELEKEFHVLRELIDH